MSGLPTQFGQPGVTPGPFRPEVRVVGFTPEQQGAYLRALNRMVDQAHARGLQFRVGLWDHIYRGGVQSGGVKDADTARPLPGVPTGLDKRNLAAYSTAALAKFLTLVPGIDGVQLRMHGESGLEPGEEMFAFWKQIYRVIRDTRPGLLVDARAMRSQFFYFVRSSQRALLPACHHFEIFHRARAFEDTGHGVIVRGEEAAVKRAADLGDPRAMKIVKGPGADARPVVNGHG